jgi:hypothetical protein
LKNQPHTGWSTISRFLNLGPGALIHNLEALMVILNIHQQGEIKNYKDDNFERLYLSFKFGKDIGISPSAYLHKALGSCKILDLTLTHQHVIFIDVGDL